MLLGVLILIVTSDLLNLKGLINGEFAIEIRQTAAYFNIILSLYK
jgi:hypothetical protein